MAYAVYAFDGDIKWVTNSKPVMEATDKFAVIECDDSIDPDGFWVNVQNGPYVQIRSKFPKPVTNALLANGEYTIQIQRLPKFTTVYWPDGFASYEIDSSIECSVQFKGEYKFQLKHAAYFDLEVTVNV
jgi:hypothetical protein